MKSKIIYNIFLCAAILLCLAFLRSNSVFAAQTDDLLLKTTRVVWKPVEGFAALSDLLNPQASDKPIKENQKITIADNRSIFYRPGRTELFRIRAQNISTRDLEIWRVSIEGNQPVRLFANEASKMGEYIIVALPFWLDDPIYEVRFSDSRHNEKRKFVVTAEKTARTAEPFYREKVLREAADSISKGVWVERSMNLWKQSEPGEQARVLYRKQVAAAPWNDAGSEPEYVRFYRRAVLERDLFDFRNEQTNSRLPLATTGEPEQSVLTADETAYVLGSKFSSKIDGSKTIEIAARVPFDNASSFGVQLYYLDVFLDDKPFERIYFDSRADNCRYQVGGQNQTVGRRRAETLLVPPGSHALRIESSTPVFLSLAAAENRKPLREAFGGDNLEDNFRRALEAANQKLVSSPTDVHARFVYAAALINLGRGTESIAQLERLLNGQIDDVFKTGVGVMLARAFFEAGKFEDALSVLPDSDPQKTSFEPRIPIESAVQIEALKERARILRRLNRHAEAAEVMSAAARLDPSSADLPLAAGDALKWSNEPPSANPAVLAQFDRALILNPGDSRLKAERRRAQNDFTFWQSQLPSRDATGAAFTILDVVANRQTVNDFVLNDENTENTTCGDGQNASESATAGANQNQFFELKPNENQKIDLTKPASAPEIAETRVRLRVSASVCPLPFELTIAADNREVLRPVIYKPDQTIEFNLSGATANLRLEGCPQAASASGAACAKFFINQPILTGGKTSVPAQIVERRYYNIAAGQNGRADFMTRDDANTTTGRILLRDLGDVGANQTTAVSFSGAVLINGKIVERFSFENGSITDLYKNTANWGFTFRVPAGRAVIAVTTDNAVGVKQFGINLSLRTRRHGAEDLTENLP